MVAMAEEKVKSFLQDTAGKRPVSKGERLVGKLERLLETTGSPGRGEVMRQDIILSVNVL